MGALLGGFFSATFEEVLSSTPVSRNQVSALCNTSLHLYPSKKRHPHDVAYYAGSRYGHSPELSPTS